MKLYPYLIGLILLCSACGGGNGKLTDVKGNGTEYENSDVNAIEQAMPQIMIIPSDGQLKANGSLNYNNGQIVRDYNKYLLNNRDVSGLYSVVQDEFVAKGFPFNDLEQTLKQLATRGATDLADDLERDAKTELLLTAAPDIILEFDYQRSIDSRSYKSSCQYTMRFIDAYTNKVFSTKTFSSSNETDKFRSALRGKMGDISKEVKQYFADELTRGREISVRITVAKGSPLNLADGSIEGETYSDWIKSYMNTHTLKGAYKLAINTRYEMSFVNVRIKTLSQDGTQYNGYDWGRDFAKTIASKLGVKVENRSQGLGDVHLVIM